MNQLRLGSRLKSTTINLVDTVDVSIQTLNESVGTIHDAVVTIRSSLQEPMYEAKLDGLNAQIAYESRLLQYNNDIAKAVGSQPTSTIAQVAQASA